MLEQIAKPLIGTEKATLQGFLNTQRDVLVWKLDGLSSEDARRPMTPTSTNLLGLVKHCATGEYQYLCIAFDRPFEPIADEASELHLIPDPGESVEEILAYYARARVAADEAIAELDLEATGTAWSGETVSLRWALTHMIDETARHVGHADIIRELLDCTVGYLPGDRQRIKVEPYTLAVPASPMGGGRGPIGARDKPGADDYPPQG
jgi:hypothetical protein